MSAWLSRLGGASKGVLQSERRIHSDVHCICTVRGPRKPLHVEVSQVNRVQLRRPYAKSYANPGEQG
jgi:hypothetical protein